jgi:hypothetical protein
MSDHTKELRTVLDFHNAIYTVRIGCGVCTRFADLDFPKLIAMGEGNTSVTHLRDRLKCSKCGQVGRLQIVPGISPDPSGRKAP